jgi:hypothetical protein
MLINLRGTSGSGKSTAVLGLLAQCPHKPIYGALGRLPEAYALCARPVFIIGPYESIAVVATAFCPSPSFPN